MRIASIVGARPQFIKAAPVCRALRVAHEEILIHSGQHYDHGMSQVFFDELGIPAPDHNLGIVAGTHGRMTGEMMAALEDLLFQISPDVVLVYGDTNTTLAGGLVAAKMNIPVAHVEAGLRSFNRSMPEEVNRIAVDHLSELLLAPTRVAMENLATEGLAERAVLVGDVMLDTARAFAERVELDAVLATHGLTPGGYYLATVHRAATTDDPAQLRAVVRAFGSLDRPVVWAVHPRTSGNLDTFGLRAGVESAPSIRTLGPQPYGATIALLRGSAGLLTDSGGMQKEAYFFGIPCVTLRNETEWVETVELGWNRLAGTDADRIRAAVSGLTRPSERPDVYGDGHAATRVAGALERLG
ncbi:MAG: UDP-N-acetylglucosamine 2-epimerase (non-hydrolyzing) [Vicinamibacterales bacterium]|nr:UDP-N-acetylglucosamine 2-epimerase (non-hydrolyzing) [Vicinamibacterales bacterium]